MARIQQFKPWIQRIKMAASRIALILAAALALAAQPMTTHQPIPLYDRPLEKHALHYSRGQEIDTIQAGERIVIQERRTVQTALGPQVWLRVERQSGKARYGWIDGARAL